jgi:hypothetical protein
VLTAIDHIVVAVVDPEAAATALERDLGIVATGGGRHSTGTFNRIAWFGDTYLEFIALADETLAAASWVGAAAIRTLQIGEGVATWAVASDDIDADIAALRELGAAFVEPLAGERTRPDGRVVRWRISAAGDLGPLEPPFLIEHDTDAAEWTPAERAERAASAHPIGQPVRLDAIELPVSPPDMNRTSQRFLRGAGLRFRPSLTGRGARDANVGRHRVRLVPASSGTPAVLRLTAPGVELRESVVGGIRIAVGG